jgi:2',3'-cyclic-nucleotide 2'-phosphodiesterase (5'-nucleotidase family)
VIVFLFVSCTKEPAENVPAANDLTIFFINDQHGQIDHFSKIGHIVKTEEHQTHVIVACSGDMFSGNPVIDNYPEKGYPMIDVMNRAGFDIAVIGNHEYDYGASTLADRMAQAEFKWVCANVDMGHTDIPELRLISL